MRRSGARSAPPRRWEAPTAATWFRSTRRTRRAFATSTGTRPGSTRTPRVSRSSTRDSQKWAFRMLVRGEPVHVPRVAELSDEARDARESLLAGGVRSYLGVPVHIGPRLVGLLGFHCLRSEKSWSPHEIAWIRLVANLFTSALERMRSDLALRESEERFRALAEHSTDPICEFSADGRFLFASPSFTELMGYPREELARLRFADLVHPEDHPALIRKYASAEGAAGAGVSIYRARHRNGSWITLEATARMFSIAGGARRVVAVLRDVTERQRSQEALRRQLDLETRIANLSRRFLTLPAEAVDDEVRRSLADLAAVSSADRIWMLGIGEPGERRAGRVRVVRSRHPDPAGQLRAAAADDLPLGLRAAGARRGDPGPARFGPPAAGRARARRPRAARREVPALHRAELGRAQGRLPDLRDRARGAQLAGGDDHAAAADGRDLHRHAAAQARRGEPRREPAPAAAGPEDGGRRHAGRRDRARLQQSAHRDARQLPLPARRGGGKPGSRGRGHRPEAGRRALRAADPLAARVLTTQQRVDPLARRRPRDRRGRRAAAPADAELDPIRGRRCRTASTGSARIPRSSSR